MFQSTVTWSYCFGSVIAQYIIAGWVVEEVVHLMVVGEKGKEREGEGVGKGKRERLRNTQNIDLHILPPQCWMTPVSEGLILFDHQGGAGWPERSGELFMHSVGFLAWTAEVCFCLTIKTAAFFRQFLEPGSIQPLEYCAWAPGRTISVRWRKLSKVTSPLCSHPDAMAAKRNHQDLWFKWTSCQWVWIETWHRCRGGQSLWHLRLWSLKHNENHYSWK